jgi:hypothetical protein
LQAASRTREAVSQLTLTGPFSFWGIHPRPRSLAVQDGCKSPGDASGGWQCLAALVSLLVDVIDFRKIPDFGVFSFVGLFGCALGRCSRAILRRSALAGGCRRCRGCRSLGAAVAARAGVRRYRVGHVRRKTINPALQILRSY